MQRKRNNIKFAKRIAAFQPIKPDVVLAHLLLHVAPGRKRALAPHAVDLIQQPVKDAQSEMRHPDFIHIRKAKRKPKIHFVLLFHDRMILAARIARRLLHRAEYPLKPLLHGNLLLCHSLIFTIISENLSFYK